MSNSQADFAERLAGELPPLAELYRQHVAENGGALPHVFLGDVSQYAIEEALRTEPGERHHLDHLLLLLDEAARTDDLRELVDASFIENIAWEESGDQLRAILPVTLRERLERLI